jgi:antitoxin Phd
MADWQVQEAKARFSELIERAQTEGAQRITRHGSARAVVLSAEDYQALVGSRGDLRHMLLGGPKLDDFDIPRDKDTGRDISF